MPLELYIMLERHDVDFCQDVLRGQIACAAGMPRLPESQHSVEPLKNALLHVGAGVWSTAQGLQSQFHCLEA